MTDQNDEDRELWRDWRKQIADDLDEHRPERYQKGEVDWMGPVIARARGRMPSDDSIIIRRHVEREVKNEEGLATKRGNKLVREWREGRRPLEQDLFGPTPIIANGVHVRFDAATRQDVRDAVDEGHVKNLENYNQAEQALDGYRVLERLAAARGYEQLSLLGDLPPWGAEEDAEAA